MSRAFYISTEKTAGTPRLSQLTPQAAKSAEESLNCINLGVFISQTVSSALGSISSTIMMTPGAFLLSLVIIFKVDSF